MVKGSFKKLVVLYSGVSKEKVQNEYSGDSGTQFAELGLIKALERITPFNCSHVHSAFV